MKRSRTRSRLLIGSAITLVLAGAGTLAYRHLYPDLDAAVTGTIDILDAQGKVVGAYHAPSAEEIAGLGNAESVMLGRRILNETARLLPDNVGNDLNCNSCHMAEGKRPFGNHYFTGGGAYPRYMPRPGKVIGLTERINGCLQRSMNGKPLPKDAPQMRAMLDYMAWLNSAVPDGAKVAAPSEGPSTARWPRIRSAARRCTPRSALPATATTAKAGATPVVTSLSRRCGATTVSTSAPAWRACTRRPVSSSTTCHRQ